MAAALLEGYAHGVELARVPARGHSEHEPPAGDHVEAAERLGRDHGIPERQDEHAGAQLDPVRAGGDGAEHGDGVEDGEGRLDAEQDVVPGPERLEAEGLRPLGIGVERLHVGHLAGADEVAYGESELGHDVLSGAPRN